MIAIIPHVPICHATESRATGRNGASPPAAFLATVRGADYAHLASWTAFHNVDRQSGRCAYRTEATAEDGIGCCERDQHATLRSPVFYSALALRLFTDTRPSFGAIGSCR
jgi:hypothetical protein